MKSYKPLYEDLEVDPVVGTSEMRVILNSSEAHIRRLARMGKIPAPMKIGTRKLGWRLSTAKKIVADCEAAAVLASTKKGSGK